MIEVEEPHGVVAGQHRAGRGVYAAEVRAFGQADQIGGEAVTADVGALPHVAHSGCGQGSHEGTAEVCAAAIVAAVGAHQVHRSVPALAQPRCSVDGQRLEVEIEQLRRIVDFKHLEPAAASARVGEVAATGARRAVAAGAADEQRPDLEPAAPLEDGRTYSAVEVALHQGVASPGAGLLEHQPRSHPRSGGHEGVATGRGRCGARQSLKHGPR